MEHKIFGGRQKVAGFFGKGGSIGLAFLGGSGPLPPRKHGPVLVGVQHRMGLVPCPYLFWGFTLEKNTADAGGFFKGLFAGGLGGELFECIAKGERGNKGCREHEFL
jgi:hypothetical protein